jgi:hypothetical protein
MLVRIRVAIASLGSDGEHEQREEGRLKGDNFLILTFF